MPRSTVKHEWEFFMLAVAEGINRGAEFYAEINADGTVGRILFHPDARPARELAAEPQSGRRYIYYDPFDAPVYMWLEWQGLTQPILRALLGERARPEIPEAWSVMF